MRLWGGDRKFSRRRFLGASALAGIGAAGAALLRPARAAQITVTFAGWAFEPQVVEANVKRFMEQNPDIGVNYTPLDLQLYNEKMVALFNAGCTPYYGDIYVYMYDKKALATANIGRAPTNLEQLKDAALEVKKAGIAQYPILKGYKTNVDGLSEFWSMVFASGGRLFNEALDPVYPNEDKTGLAVLEWMVEAMHSWQILDRRGLELDETQARDVFLSGQGVFTSNVGNVFPRVNNPAHSKRAGDIVMMRFPGLRDAGRGPMGWTRLYGISADTRNRDAALRLIYYMGGKDRHGVYFSAKDWYLKYGVGYAFKSLDDDAEIVEAQNKAGYDRDVLQQQYGAARARENINAPWYSEWDRFTQQQIQNTLLRRVKPLDALAASAKKAQELKKAG